jgi:hypothetical protein
VVSEALAVSVVEAPAAAGVAVVVASVVLAAAPEAEAVPVETGNNITYLIKKRARIKVRALFMRIRAGIR